PGENRDDLHHLRRDVGISVDRLLLIRPDAQAHHAQGQEQHDPALVQSRLDDAVHRRPPSGGVPALATELPGFGACKARATTVLRRMAPFPSPRSPAFRPARTSTLAPRVSPTCTSVIFQVSDSLANSA